MKDEKFQGIFLYKHEHKGDFQTCIRVALRNATSKATDAKV